jgi:serine/threonine protein kinase
MGYINYTKVQEATKRDSGEVFGVLCMKKSSLSPAEEASLLNKASLMVGVDDPNILKAYGLFNEKYTYFLVVERFPITTLGDYLVNNTVVQIEDAVLLVKGILHAIRYLHSKGLVHRGVNLDIFLVDRNPSNGQLKLKLADFGDLTKAEPVGLITMCGTPSYSSPEMIRGDSYGREVDMWAVGVVSYALLCGYLPFDGYNLPDTVNQIYRAKYSPFPDTVPPLAVDFVGHLLVVNPQDRYTAEQALSHLLLLVFL